jgi:predicted RNase H-like HicB family nuclease
MIGHTLDFPYTIELHSSPDEGWFARVSELPGCMSQGETAEDALANVQEAMQLWLEVSMEQGNTIPEPQPDVVRGDKFIARG